MRCTLVGTKSGSDCFQPEYLFCKQVDGCKNGGLKTGEGGG